MAITAQQVKELREKSGAGVMDAKKALVETDGDIEKAMELLREKGMATAAKKQDRIAAEGLTGIFVNGNTATIVEVNSETDFVAKNDQFVALVEETAEVIGNAKPANNEEALLLTNAKGQTLADAFVEATSTIGEKISFRRFAVIDKEDAQSFGAYKHGGGRIGVVIVVDGADEAIAKQLAMHAAAQKPKVLSYKDLDAEFVKDELAQMNHAIDQDNESRAMVGKPALPHMTYGSRSQINEGVLAEAKTAIEEELKSEGKPEKIWDKIIPGKMSRFLLDNTKVDQEYTLLGQKYIMDDSKTVEEYLESISAT
ncbi:MAG: translation elongation factor Ts, partial [Streptococcaceae bacterium]|nr:translation elongation factor Ts [Streptococcaceae bacterium]